MSRVIIIGDEKENKTTYRKLSERVGRFYTSGKGMNLPGLANFDEGGAKNKLSVLKRKWY